MVSLMMKQSNQKVMGEENTSLSRSYRIDFKSPSGVDSMGNLCTHLIKNHKLENGLMLTFRPLKSSLASAASSTNTVSPRR